MKDKLNQLNELLEIELNSTLNHSMDSIQSLIPLARDMETEKQIYKLINHKSSIKGLDYIVSLVNKTII